MLEKIGLPPKPALKGNDWVLDASHCQGCSSAFTFFNRKHHCRRCGGIFCGSCTQQRIILRGQGEGPVRVCEPCKKLEEAARFESRYGHRNKVSKAAGTSKSNSLLESDPQLKELLEHDSNLKNAKMMDEVSELIGSKHARSMSTGNIGEAGKDELSGTQVTPEMLLSQAQEEKRQWLALKKEGKGEEALHAFKRGKELERQAENLKLSLRRSQRKATSLIASKKEKPEESIKSEQSLRTNDPLSGNTQGDNDVMRIKAKGTGLKEPKQKKDDLMDALKEIGWSDADLHEAEGKQSKAKTVENELAELAAAVHHGNDNHRQTNTSSMEVLAHKRRALALKREGHLAEAKEELKKAKLMERQLEEQQMFGGEDEESDEDLRALIRGMDKESLNYTPGGGAMDFSILGNIDHDEGEGIDVTDIDMDDPEMVAALRSMGWVEEVTQMEDNFQRPARPSNRSYGQRSGVHKSQNAVVEHMDVLGNMDLSLDDVEATEDDMKDPTFLSALKAMGFDEEEPSKLIQSLIPDSKDKKRLQQEVQFLKKEALVLKRAGKLQEAKEELRRAKQVEKELKDWESQNKEEAVLAAFSVQQPSHDHEREADISQQAFLSLDEDADHVDITEEDMEDPELAKTLKSLGWQDDHESEDVNGTEEESEPYVQSLLAAHKSKTKAELQKELLGVKRAALKLRREGKGEEAEEELKKAEVLEQLLEEAGRVSTVKEGAKRASEKTTDGIVDTEKMIKVSKPGREDPTVLENVEKLPHVSPHIALPPTQAKESEEFATEQSSSLDRKQPEEKVDIKTDVSSTNASQQNILALKRQALALRREGKQMEAKEKLKEAKVLEMKFAAEHSHSESPALPTNKKAEEDMPPTAKSAPAPSKPARPSGTTAHNATLKKDRMKLQQESLAHKRKALALRREGNTEAADMEFELAKSIEKQMEELEGMTEERGAMPQEDVGSVDDIFDPQLLAALKGLGWKENEIVRPTPEVRREAAEKPQEVSHKKSSEVTSGPSRSKQDNEREQLEKEIKAERIRAAQLKQSGQRAEALNALRGAKLLEKKLEALS